MAACWLLAPAPTRSPLSSVAPPVVVVPPPPALSSLAAPQAVSARVPASAVERTTARDVVLSFKEGALRLCARTFCRAARSQRGPTLGSRGGRLPVHR